MFTLLEDPESQVRSYSVYIPSGFKMHFMDNFGFHPQPFENKKFSRLNGEKHPEDSWFV